MGLFGLLAVIANNIVEYKNVYEYEFIYKRVKITKTANVEQTYKDLNKQINDIHFSE